MGNSLRIGAMLGHYRIVAPLGAGGMGEVWKAYDTKLDRPVALKLLPPGVVRDPERIRRFSLEARSISALSHPNLVTIYDIDQATPAEEDSKQPADGEPLPFITMELIEGSTFRQILDDKSTDLRTSIAYLAQAADGLAKAHGAGVVHRDIKPENVMVSRDGYTKVLDFGLAKLTESTSAPALSSLETAVREQDTREGVIVGTVGYMSPEQVEGTTVDHRTDVFSFGCLLYEAATGQRAFRGDSKVDVMHAIIHDRPEPVEGLNPNAPRVLVRLIRRCLAKDPERRVQSMKDLALELHDMVDEWESLELPSGPVSSGSSSSTITSLRGGLRGAGWIVIVVDVLVVAVIGVIAFRYLRAKKPPPLEQQKAPALQSMRIAPLTSFGDVKGAALSPDGRYLAVTRSGENGMSLWVRQVATESDVEVVKPSGPDSEVFNAVFTPDGNYLVYEQPESGVPYWDLYQVPVLGGTPRKLVHDLDTPPAFSPDGHRIAFVRNLPQEALQRVIVVDLEGGVEKVLATRKESDGHRFLRSMWGVGPAWSADGSWIAVPAADFSSGVRYQIVGIDTKDGKQTTITVPDWRQLDGLSWRPDGKSLVASAAGWDVAAGPQLWNVPWPDGKITRITNDLSGYSNVSLSADGRRLATVLGTDASSLWSVPLVGTGTGKPLAPAAHDFYFSLSAAEDGTLVYAMARGTSVNVWKLVPGQAQPTRLTHDEAINVSPVVSRDGSTVVFLRRDADGVMHLYAMDADGSRVHKLSAPPGPLDFSLSPDGSTLWFGSYGKGISRMPTDGDRATRVVDDTSAWAPVVSPDGRYLLYQATVTSGAGAENVVKVIPAEGGKPIAVLPRVPGTSNFTWSPDGKGIVCSVPEGPGENIWRMSLDASRPSRLTHFESTRIVSFAFVDHGRTLIYSKDDGTSDAVMITGF